MRIVAASIAGGALFNALGIPAGWLSGAMVAMALLAAAGYAEKLSEPLRVAAMVASGAAIGAGISPQVLHGFGRYPVSIAIMAMAVAAITLAGAALVGRAPGFSRETAFFASVPGALSYVFAVAGTTEADVPRIAVVQVLRIFLLMAVLPALVAETGLAAAASGAGVSDPVWMVIVIFAGSWLAGAALEKFGIAGGLLFGGMLVSGALHASALAPGKLPAILSIAGQVLVGCWSGSRFVGFDWRLLGGLLPVSLGAFALTMAIALFFAGTASWMAATPFSAALLAFAPGGLEAMTLLAFALGIDPLFVGVHHLARFVLIAVSLPLAARFWLRPASGPIDHKIGR